MPYDSSTEYVPETYNKNEEMMLESSSIDPYADINTSEADFVPTECKISKYFTLTYQINVHQQINAHKLKLCETLYSRVSNKRVGSNKRIG